MIRMALIIGGIIAIIGSYGVTYNMGRWNAQAECTSGNLAAQLKEAQDNILRLETAAKAAREVDKGVDTYGAQKDDRIAALERELDAEKTKPQPEPQVVHVPAEPAPSACPPPGNPGAAPRNRPYGATRDDLRRLRSIGPD